MQIFNKKKSDSLMFDKDSIRDRGDHKEMEIPSLWLQFLTLKNEMTTKAYAISEFIDNSISSYVKMTGKENEFYDLRINIRIFQKINTETKKVEQSIQIEDNAGGMSEQQLFRSIIMNDTENKASSDLNQYGYGMKLGIFWLGHGFEIHTKEASSDIEYFTKHLIDTVEKANEKAYVKVYPTSSFQKKIKHKSGTLVEVLKIHEENLFEINEIEDDLKQKIASRYAECINRGLTISILFSDEDQNISKSATLKGDDGKIFPYVLNDVLNYYLENKSISFDKEKYIENLKSKLDEKDETELLKFTSNVSFKEKLLRGFPLTFSFKTVLNNKETTVNWGIVAMDKCEKNNFSYRQLSGFKLIHNCRSIIHGPNESSARQRNKKLNMEAFSIPTENTGGNTTWIRIYGDIDLTGIEKPERNKRDFIWSAMGRNNINNILSLLWTAAKPFTNLIREMEDDESIQKSCLIQKRSKNTSIATVKKIFSPSKVDADFSDEENPEFTIKNMNIFGDHKPVMFKIFPINTSEAKALDIQKKGASYVEITINLKHSLFSYYYSTGNTKDLIYSYALAVALSICKFRYDGLLDKNYSSVGSICHESFNFDEIFNKVVKELCQ